MIIFNYNLVWSLAKQFSHTLTRSMWWQVCPVQSPSIACSLAYWLL